jgi:Transglutaminase-like superfamily
MKHNVMCRTYMREATVMLTLAKVVVRWLPPARLLKWAGQSPRRTMRFASDEIHWVTWAVEVIGDKKWMRAPCLSRALAAQAMLRRRGIGSSLCLGVARTGTSLAAHAWIELGQEIIVGGAEAPSFTRLVEFGGARS